MPRRTRTVLISQRKVRGGGEHRRPAGMAVDTTRRTDQIARLGSNTTGVAS